MALAARHIALQFRRNPISTTINCPSARRSPQDNQQGSPLVSHHCSLLLSLLASLQLSPLRSHLCSLLLSPQLNLPYSRLVSQLANRPPNPLSARRDNQVRSRHHSRQLNHRLNPRKNRRPSHHSSPQANLLDNRLVSRPASLHPNRLINLLVQLDSQRVNRHGSRLVNLRAIPRIRLDSPVDNHRANLLVSHLHNPLDSLREHQVASQRLCLQ